jgi:hypothetical protein
MWVLGMAWTMMACGGQAENGGRPRSSGGDVDSSSESGGAAGATSPAVPEGHAPGSHVGGTDAGGTDAGATNAGGTDAESNGSAGMAGAMTACNCEDPIVSEAAIRAVRQPLACGCSDCPTEEEALSASCGGEGIAAVELLMTTGCGVRAVRQSNYHMGAEHFFDETTGELLGVRTWNDVRHGECGVWEYQYGEVRTACPDAVTCNACPQASDSALPPCD